MVSTSTSNATQTLVVEQQPGCGDKYEHQQCDQTSANIMSNSNGKLNSGRSSTSNSDRLDDQEATSSSSPSGLRNDEFRRRRFSHNRSNLTPGAHWAREIYRPTIEGLHHEIKDLYFWLKPTAEEIACRRKLFNKISLLLKDIWPDSDVNMFGSVATNSFLPTSDVDICVITREKIELPDDLNAVADALRRTDDFEEIIVLDKTAVPIVKCLDKRTQLRVDINFNLRYLTDTVKWICKKMRELPLLEPLLLILKQFLVQHSLNNPFNGGLPSYALVVMLVYFLEMIRVDSRRFVMGNIYNATLLGKRPLGVLFHYFLFYYGYTFDFTVFGIKVTPKPELVRKELLANEIGENVCTSGLWISDPVKKENNLGKGAHNMMAIKVAFCQAYNAISNALRYCNSLTPEFRRRFYRGPVLSLIIAFTPDALQHRAHLIWNSRMLLFPELYDKKLGENELTEASTFPNA